MTKLFERKYRSPVSWAATASVLAAVATSTVLVTAGPANAESASGYKNCIGKGKIVVKVNWWSDSKLEVAVKQAGPPNSPTWGMSIPGNPTAPSEIYQSAAFVSPYQEGRWSVYSPRAVVATAVCSNP